jgi:hypothetical protein
MNNTDTTFSAAMKLFAIGLGIIVVIIALGTCCRALNTLP